ncbi:MAG: divalent-cation tolerance protein CutA [Acidobacteriales bacterium]|nr:MAG: divalent-cation tolerance protein CutA [Terriglobales bacterium]
MTGKIVVLTTCASAREAETIARALVEKRLAACVNILPGVRSIYRWCGAIEDGAEVLLLIKSRRNLFDELRAEIEKVHSYETPEVLALDVTAVSAAYLSWLDAELKPEA